MSIVTEMKEQIKALEEKISKIQEQCSHPPLAVKSKNGSNTGNYDPSQDSYWTDYHCTLCDKHWTTPQ